MKHFPQGLGDIMWPRKVQTVRLLDWHWLELVLLGITGITMRPQPATDKTSLCPHGQHKPRCMDLSPASFFPFLDQDGFYPGIDNTSAKLTTTMVFALALFFNRAVLNWSCSPSDQC
ncbi:hypothetical protein J3458_004267 [Metarhizium acridum]|uniref:uncharacterized protein n=1 Tax=Metarhizium acridum TaxID=92637 RepID=UPI001C6C028E|nr:hypothetical protein J3458_004267 [Metarhizium acridum]